MRVSTIVNPAYYQIHAHRYSSQAGTVVRCGVPGTRRGYALT